jgi:hypothetical protein
MTNTFRLAVILFLLRFHPSLGAATLTQETKTAWGAYLQAPMAHFAALWNNASVKMSGFYDLSGNVSVVP